MATEQFLVNPMDNPPKKAPSRKRKHIHRILALEGKGGGLFTSKGAKIVRKGIKLNPFHFKRNPLGEELMFVGLNPRKGGKAMATHKKHHKRHRKNPVRKHRRYHHNPMASMKSLLPMAVSGGAGALVGRTVPQYIPFLKGFGTIGEIASRLLLAFGGSMLIDKAGLHKKLPMIFNAEGWVIGSVAGGVADMGGQALHAIPGTSGIGMFVDNTLAPYTPAQSMGEFVDGTGSNPFVDDSGVYQG